MNHQAYFISSENRLSGSLSNFNYKLPNFNKSLQYDSILLDGLSIPKTYYLIDTNRNTFIIRENVTNYTVVLSDGCYTAYSLLTEISSKMALSGAAFTYDITFSIITGRYLFSVSNNVGVQPSLVFSNTKTANILGFSALSNPFLLDELYSTQVIKLQAIDSILVSCNFVANQTGILQSVYPNTNDFSSIQYQQIAPTQNTKPMFSKVSDVIEFTLSDFADGSLITFHGGVVLLSIVLFKRDDTLQNLNITNQLLLESNLMNNEINRLKFELKRRDIENNQSIQEKEYY